MIKHTIYFENPSYLSLNNGQLFVRLPGIPTLLSLKN
ncbi:MAG: hypothetical protein FNNCIFGK_02033 [Bacteroidia bacterium]|nr:MAG: hypothetical protein UZ10_BCD003000700 [Bacteroidetes bacterium OLB10]MBV6454764.1 hypothetical protein [Bacteroidia bacterium]